MNPIESYMTACTLITITASVVSIVVNEKYYGIK